MTRIGRSEHGFAVVVLLVMSIAVPAAAQGVDAVRVTPAQGLSKDWKRVSSAHFVAEGDASEKDLRGALVQLESFRSALGRLHPGLRFSAAIPTRIILFRNPGAFTRFKPRDAKGKPQRYVGGYFTTGPYANYIVVGSYGGSANYETIFHEYTHYIVRQNMGSLPLWLNEGLADFYSTFELQNDGRALIGRPPQGRLAWLRTDGLRPLGEIISPRETDRMWRNPAVVSTFYAESWAFVHYLMIGRPPGTRPPLASYMDAARKGSSPDEILTAAFGVDADRMLGELRTYIRKPSFGAVILPMPADVNTSSDLVATTELEARLVRAELLVINGATDDAEKELSPLAALATENPDVAVAFGQLRMAQNRTEEGLAFLSRAAVLAPANFAAQVSLGHALAAAWRHDEALDAFDRAIGINPGAPAPWFGLSVSALALGREAQSNATFQRSLSLDADRDRYRARAYAALAFGQYGVALADARAYIAQVGWGDESAQYTALAALIAARRLGDPDAKALADELIDALDDKAWTFQVVQYLTGKLSSEQLLSRAKGDGQKTEAHAYIGFQMETDGARQGALTHLQWVADEGARNYIEYRMVLSELERIRRQPR